MFKKMTYIHYCALAVATIAAHLGIVSSVYKKIGIKEDNIIEEAIEKMIEENTKVKLDLTPSSPE